MPCGTHPVQAFAATDTGRAASRSDGLQCRVQQCQVQYAAQQLVITVVPDSGAGALAGITGTLAIEIADGVHRYRFDYALPAATDAPAHLSGAS